MHKHIRLVAGVAAAMLMGCSSMISPVLPTPTDGAVLPTTHPTSSASATAAVTLEPLLLPTARPSDVPPLTATPESAWLPGEVRVYPGPEHFEGDLLSFEILVENIHDLGGLEGASLAIDGKPQEFSGAYIAYSPLRQHVVVFRWVWDTTDEVGTHEISVSVPTKSGELRQQSFVVAILPAQDRPASEEESDWMLAESECCNIEYISGTAADRDIEAITTRADAAVEHVEDVFGIDITEAFPIVLIDNVWGNGAFASDHIVLSYVDRSYVSLDLDSVIRHEAVHYATRETGRNTPVILVEGIAVYVSGGHYKPEPIPERTAALIELDRYIPLADLADHFRAHQHEIAYLEAAGLIAYLTETYGWDAFVELYALEDISDGSASGWLNEAFERTYSKSLDEVENEFIEWLEAKDSAVQVEDLRLTIKLFDTIRRYQKLYAPYQEDLGPLTQATDQDITSEYMREPTAPENIAIEVTLIHAREALASGDFVWAETLIDALNLLMDTGDFSMLPIQDYLSIAEVLDAAGYEAQYIQVTGDSASVTAIRAWPRLEDVMLQQVDGKWQISESD